MNEGVKFSRPSGQDGRTKTTDQIVVEIEINVDSGGFDYEMLSRVQTGFQNLVPFVVLSTLHSISNYPRGEGPW